MFANPQLAYKAGFALLDITESTDEKKFLRHVNEAGNGMVYAVPTDEIVLEVLVRSLGHGDIYGAPLAEVEAAATEKRALQ